MPLTISIDLELVDILSRVSTFSNQNVEQCNRFLSIIQLDWVSSRKVEYYECTRTLFLSLLKQIETMYQKVFYCDQRKTSHIESNHNLNIDIEYLYNNIVHCLFRHSKIFCTRKLILNSFGGM
jgi:hypothetical protein